MIDLLLIGGGGHCRSCIDVIEAENHYRIRGIVQPLSDAVDGVLGYPVVGSDEDLPALLKKTAQAIVTVGQIRSPEVRVKLFELLKQLGAELPIIVSPIAYCSKNSEMGEGTIVMHGAIVNVGSRIGVNCIVNSQAVLDHDVRLADHCHVSTGVRINGGVVIGKGSFIGSGATIKEGVVIGDNVIISAGQVVLRDVPNGAVIKHG